MIAVLGGRPAARGYRTLSQHSNTDLVDDANLLETAGMKHCWLPTIGQCVSFSAGRLLHTGIVTEVLAQS